MLKTIVTKLRTLAASIAELARQAYAKLRATLSD